MKLHGYQSSKNGDQGQDYTGVVRLRANLQSEIDITLASQLPRVMRQKCVTITLCAVAVLTAHELLCTFIGPSSPERQLDQGVSNCDFKNLVRLACSH